MAFWGRLRLRKAGRGTGRDRECVRRQSFRHLESDRREVCMEAAPIRGGELPAHDPGMSANEEVRERHGRSRHIGPRYPLLPILQEGSWLTRQLAEFLPRHRRSQRGLAHGLHTCRSTLPFGALRLLQADEQQTSFRLLLDVKDIARSPTRQDDPLLGINGRCAHGGIILQGASSVKERHLRRLGRGQCALSPRRGATTGRQTALSEPKCTRLNRRNTDPALLSASLDPQKPLRLCVSARGLSCLSPACPGLSRC